MKMSEMEAGLYCTQCHDETIHRVVYVNNKIQSIECEGCHSITNMKIDTKKELYEEVYDRVSTKPSRLLEESKRDLSKFFRVCQRGLLVSRIDSSNMSIKQEKC